MEPGLWPPTALPRGPAAAPSFMRNNHLTLNWQGPRVGGQDTGHPKLPLKAGPQHQSSARRTFLQKGRVGVTVEGERAPSWARAASRAGGQGRSGRGQETVFCLCLCMSCLLGGVPMAGASVLDPEVDCSMDVILVGSSELSAPPSPEPCRGEGPSGANPCSGCQPRAGQH